MINEVVRLREITEALINKKYLVDRAEECQYALDAIPECVLIVDTNDVVRFANLALAERLGADCDRWPCEHDFSAICTHDELDLGVLNEDEELERYVKRLDGWFSCCKSPIFSEIDVLTGYVVVLRDITKLKEYQQAMEASERRYRTIFEQSMDAIVLLDSKGHIVECNEKANELFVCGCRRVDGWHVSGLFPEFQSTGERTEDLFREFVSYVGESKHTVFEMTGHRCDGTEICLVVKLSRVEYLNSVAFLVNMSEATTMRQLVPRCGASF